MNKNENKRSNIIPMGNLHLAVTFPATASYMESESTDSPPAWQ